MPKVMFWDVKKLLEHDFVGWRNDPNNVTITLENNGRCVFKG